MIFEETPLKGAFVITIRQINDERGFFGRAWCKKEMEEHGLNGNVVQSNVSFNKVKGTLRGFHYQKPPHEEAKLVRCLRGAIYDVIVDLRRESPTYLKWCGTELTAGSYKMLYVPENFAHCFITIEDNTEVTYMSTGFYEKDAEAGLRYNDPALGIIWPVEVAVISDKDSSHPLIDVLAVPR